MEHKIAIDAWTNLARAIKNYAEVAHEAFKKNLKEEKEEALISAGAVTACADIVKYMGCTKEYLKIADMTEDILRRLGDENK